MALTRVASDMYLNTEQILLLRDRTEGAAGSLTIRLVDGYELKLPVSAWQFLGLINGDYKSIDQPAAASLTDVV